MSALPLADGPAMYLGGSIMTFALPYGAFIAATIALYFLLRSNHSGPRLKYLDPGHFRSVATREPGPAPAPAVQSAEVTAMPETSTLPGALPLETPQTPAPETGGGEA